MLEIERERGKGRNAGSVISSPLRRAKDEASLSERQARTMMEVARVPQDLFERAVEDDPPATVPNLAEMVAS